MGTRPIKFRVENNKSKTTYWYTLVAGNGDTVMTSKATYSEKSGAKRAAKRMITALGASQLVLEYEESKGIWVQEAVETVVSWSPQEAVSIVPSAAAVKALSTTAGHMTPMSQPSTRVADEHLNPNR